MPSPTVVRLRHSLAGPALAETLDGGQCFRWRQAADGAWHGVSGRVAARLYPRSHDTLAADLHSGSVDDLLAHLADDVDWPALADALPWRTDTHLARCIAAFPGLRILRQPIGETLLCFLCSATKQIVQIKQMVALLAERLGTPLPPGTCQPMVDTPSSRRDAAQCHPLGDNSGPRGSLPAAGRTTGRGARPGNLARAAAKVRGAQASGGDPADRDCQLLGDIAAGRRVARDDDAEIREARPVGALPTWGQLAGVSEKELRECLLGFRARHVAGVARFLAERPGWLEETARLPYPEAKARLVELPGVGEKIADCVLLFGAGKLEAFPVDVWILRVMEQRYGLQGWRPAQVAQFGRAHFGPLAGLAQQYLFAWERLAARTAM